MHEKTNKMIAKSYNIKQGDKFGRLTVIKRVSDRLNFTGGSISYFLCRCDCGKILEVTGSNLSRGTSKSCGCLQKDIISKNSFRHGISKTHIYRTYTSMIRRCYDKKDDQYALYGGRGITVCKEWYNPNYNNGYDPECVLNFYNWSINCKTYNDLYTLDRIDPNSNYCPENCRWEDSNIQANNKRNTMYITYNGETQTAGNWEKIKGLTHGNIRNRLKRGWDLEMAINKRGSDRPVPAIYFVDNNGNYITEKYAKTLFPEKFKDEEYNYMPKFNSLID